MAGGRRCPSGRNATSPRLQFGAPAHSLSTTSCINATGYSEEKKQSTEQFSSRPTLAPKHVPIPSVPVDGQVHFEALSLATSLVTASLQLLNLYKSVWWLPLSYNEYSMNFYLIDPYLLVFILTMAGRQLVYALLCKFMDVVIPSRWMFVAQKVMRVLLSILVISILVWCLFHMSLRHNTMKVFYLCYPCISIYILMFGIRIGPFFDISSPPIYVKEDRKTKFFIDKPLHNCSLNAPTIRAEVASLRSDFNLRLKKVLFASSGSAYLCGIAPVIFVPQHLHFDVGWVVQLVLLIWLGRLGAHFTQAYPVRYCDVLHRAAVHLGKWSKVGNAKNAHLTPQVWSDAVLWPHGSLVKHNKELYQSEGLCTAAEPGNSSHSRFYALFGNLTVLQGFLLGLEMALIAVQLLILIRTTEWYRVLSMSLLIVTNYYTLFRITRNYLVCWRLNRAEQIIQGKVEITMSNNAQ